MVTCPFDACGVGTWMLHCEVAIVVVLRKQCYWPFTSYSLFGTRCLQSLCRWSYHCSWCPSRGWCSCLEVHVQRSNSSGTLLSIRYISWVWIGGTLTPPALLTLSLIICMISFVTSLYGSYVSFSFSHRQKLFVLLLLSLSLSLSLLFSSLLLSFGHALLI